jgi:hypothetical protein
VVDVVEACGVVICTISLFPIKLGCTAAGAAVVELCCVGVELELLEPWVLIADICVVTVLESMREELEVAKTILLTVGS